jgi:hypothetical protein
MLSQGVPRGVAGAFGSIYLSKPPYLAVVVDVGVVAAGLVAAVVVDEGFVAAGFTAVGLAAVGLTTAGLVADGWVAAAVVGTGELVPQPVIMKAHTKRTTKGTSRFFILTSSTNFCMNQDNLI